MLIEDALDIIEEYASGRYRYHSSPLLEAAKTLADEYKRNTSDYTEERVYDA